MSFVVYGLIGLMPGDPIDLQLSADPDMTPADAARLRAIHGLDRPFLARYLAWLGAALQGDLGTSRVFARPAAGVLADHLGNTLLLMGLSLALATATALPAGLLAAARRGSWIDRALNAAALAGASVPSFWLGLMLIILFAVRLGWLPAGGAATPGADGVADRAAHLVLPVLTLALPTAGILTRFVRAAVLEASAADHVRTARAKGAGPARVLLRHVLPNAMPSILTITALNLGGVVSGALVVETLFAYRGMGKLIYDSIMANDYNTALAGLLLATLVTLACNLAADAAHARIDPRVARDDRRAAGGDGA